MGEDVTCFDVAQYILQKQGKMTAMKLQKLVYYCQAWSLVWDEKPLFKEKIEAWANGPVIRELFEFHRGMFEVDSIAKGDPSKMSDAQKETINAVLSAYANKPAQWLSDLTHLEKPWSEAREGLSEGEPSDREITLASLHEYYSSLLPNNGME